MTQAYVRRFRPGRIRTVTALALIAAASVSADPPSLAAQTSTANGAANAQAPANYPLAARFAPYRVDRLIYSTSVDPRWIEGSERFWYEWETSSGTHYYIVDPARRSRREIFDNDRIAAELTRITRDPWDAQHLPIRSIRFIDANTLQFDVESSQDEDDDDDELLGERQEEEGERRSRSKKKVFHFEYDVDTQTLRELEDYEEPDDHPSWASVSPDGQTVVYALHDDLYTMDASEYAKILDARRGRSGAEADSAEWKVGVREERLTTDGEERYGYGVGDRGMTDNEKEEAADRRKRAAVVWASDSRRFAVVRSDQREVADLWVIHATGNERPELESYPYDMPGEEDVTQQEIWIFDLPTRSGTKVSYADEWADESLDISRARQFYYPDSEEPRRSLWLEPGSDRLHFVRLSRDRHRADVMVADATTGEARPVIEERMNTYLETRNPERLPDGDLVWWSERDGWAHLYRYGADGTPKGRLTEGPYSVREVVAVAPDGRSVFFQAGGREDGEDPYYLHTYRVGVDGSGLRLLDSGNFDHRSEMGESARYVVTNRSRVNTVPEAMLRDANGNTILELEKADFSQLFAAGWQMPEPFAVKAADGVTDLYGVIYRPFDFDPGRSYPIIEYVYPGPQTESVAKSFSTSRFESALAQLGFVVVTVGNRGGNPARSKWYHNYGYGNLRDYALADKKAAAEQLAARYPYIDLDRVGIYGHSGGGFMSTAAMLIYPDFFKVAVSSSGNHTNDIYNRWWSETHHGVKEIVEDSGAVKFQYDIDTNPELAANLKGRLLLTTGDIDNNVHPANTYRMAEALIRANKRFDFFLFPGQRHGYGNMSDYWFWLRAEYFVQHLLGDDRGSADIKELQLEAEADRRGR